MNSVDKWRRHKGIISVKMGEDLFELKLKNAEIPRFFRIANAMSKQAGMTENIKDEMLELCKAGLKEANPDIDDATLKDFVEANGFKLIMALMKELGE